MAYVNLDCLILDKEGKVDPDTIVKLQKELNFVLSNIDVSNMSTAATQLFCTCPNCCTGSGSTVYIGNSYYTDAVLFRSTVAPESSQVYSTFTPFVSTDMATMIGFHDDNSYSYLLSTGVLYLNGLNGVAVESSSRVDLYGLNSVSLNSEDVISIGSTVSSLSTNQGIPDCVYIGTSTRNQVYINGALYSPSSTAAASLKTYIDRVNEVDSQDILPFFAGNINPVWYNAQSNGASTAQFSTVYNCVTPIVSLTFGYYIPSHALTLQDVASTALSVFYAQRNADCDVTKAMNGAPWTSTDLILYSPLYNSFLSTQKGTVSIYISSIASCTDYALRFDIPAADMLFKTWAPHYKRIADMTPVGVNPFDYTTTIKSFKVESSYTAFVISSTRRIQLQVLALLRPSSGGSTSIDGLKIPIGTTGSGIRCGLLEKNTGDYVVLPTSWGFSIVPTNTTNEDIDSLYLSTNYYNEMRLSVAIHADAEPYNTGATIYGDREPLRNCPFVGWYSNSSRYAGFYRSTVDGLSLIVNCNGAIEKQSVWLNSSDFSTAYPGYTVNFTKILSSEGGNSIITADYVFDNAYLPYQKRVHFCLPMAVGSSDETGRPVFGHYTESTTLSTESGRNWDRINSFKIGQRAFGAPINVDW